MYSLWMLLVVLRKHRKYLFSSWFLWATITTGIIFCFTSCIGYAGAATRSKMFLSCYILCIFLVLLMEILVIGDVYLNDHWEKDFPNDPADRFDHFLDFVDSHESTFRFLVFLILLLQVTAFALAMALRVIGKRVRSHLDHDANQVSAGLPFLAHQVGPTSPYVMGHPLPAAQSNVEKDSMSSGEREAWLMSTYGCPQPSYV